MARPTEGKHDATWRAQHLSLSWSQRHGGGPNGDHQIMLVRSTDTNYELPHEESAEMVNSRSPQKSEAAEASYMAGFLSGQDTVSQIIPDLRLGVSLGGVFICL